MACWRYNDGLCMGGPCDVCIDGNRATEPSLRGEFTMAKVLRTFVMMVVFLVTFVILWVVDR